MHIEKACYGYNQNDNADLTNCPLISPVFRIQGIGVLRAQLN